MKRLLNNTSWILLNHIFQMVLNFIIGIITVRYLGPSNYGDITYITSYVAFFSSLSLMGLDTVVIKELVKNPDRDGEIIASATFLRITVSLISVLAVPGIVLVMDNGDPVLIRIAILNTLRLVFYAFDTIAFWYQYKLLSKKIALADMAAFTLASIYRIYILATAKNIYWFAFYETFIYLVSALFYIPLFLKDEHSPVRVRKDICLNLLKTCIPYMISGVMVTLYMTMDKIMIKQILHSSDEVAFYSSAVIICNLIAFIPNSISLSARPVLIEMKQQKAQNYETRTSQVMAVIIWIGIVYSVLIDIFSPFIVNVLYGPDYIKTASVLRILVWCTLAENLIKIRDTWLINAGQSRFVTVFSTAGTILNIIVNALLIPKIGIYGAAAATIVTQFAVTLFIPAVFSETRLFAKDVINAMFLHNISLGSLIREVKDAVFKR